MYRTIIVALFLSCISCRAERKNTVDANSVQTKEGIISGKTTAAGAVKIFTGIPFAAPPVAELCRLSPQKNQPPR
jgi:hypothetical protein